MGRDRQADLAPLLDDDAVDEVDLGAPALLHVLAHRRALVLAALLRIAQRQHQRFDLVEGGAVALRCARQLFRVLAGDDAPRFTEGRSARQWLRHLYEPTRRALLERGAEAPEFDGFWETGELALPTWSCDGGIVRAFRRDPVAAPLPTPSGRIEIASAKIAGFGYADCPGHPTWLPPAEPPDPRFPLQFVANQPATRLHSQLDFGATSLKSKIKDREPVRIHPQDAAARGIGDGDIVRLYNDRGACLAGAVLSEALRPGVVQLSTGAWYDPEDPSSEKPMCVHGNPNVVTRDTGTSKLAQGCTGQLTVIEIERFGGALPPVKAFDPP